MIKITLYAKKKTPGYLRWDVWVEENGAPFEFYINKWRVPQPWPARIFVSIDSFTSDPSDFTQSPYDSDNLNKPIKVLVEHVDEYHTKTTKYTPVGDEKGRQIGEPFIPKSILTSEFSSIPDKLIIEVNWDLESEEKFEDAPTYREDL